MYLVRVIKNITLRTKVNIAYCYILVKRKIAGCYLAGVYLRFSEVIEPAHFHPWRSSTRDREIRGRSCDLKTAAPIYTPTLELPWLFLIDILYAIKSPVKAYFY